MSRLYGGQQLVLHAILNSEKDSAGYVRDGRIAESLRMELAGLRDWVRTLEEQGLVEVAKTTEGLRILPTPAGRLALHASLTAPAVAPVAIDLPPAPTEIGSRLLFPSDALRGRDQVPKLGEEAANASELFIFGVSLISVVISHQSFFIEFLRKRSRLGLLLCDPEETGLLSVWDALGRTSFGRSDIDRSLTSIEEVVKSGGISSDDWEVRLAPFLPPYSGIVVDPRAVGGWMLIELHCYKRNLGQRPHLRLSRKTERRWFDYFSEETECMWADARVWGKT